MNRRGLLFLFVAAVPSGCGGDSRTERLDAGGPGATVDASAIDGGVTGVDAASDGAVLPACSSLINPVYIMTGDCQVPVLKSLGKLLRASANPITLVWFVSPSCTIVDALYSGTPLQQIPSYIPDDATWDPVAGAVPSCALENSGHSIDIGMPVGFPEACTSTPPPSDVVAFKGPVQSLLFVVPHSASPQAISSQQAAQVFGTGSAAAISPWLDEDFYFILKPAMAVQFSLGALIGVPAAKWHGQAVNLPSTLATKVATSTSPEETIGILGGEIFDSGNNRANLKALAFQAVGQTHGFLPDSTATAFDKRSLRDGHYVPWNQLVYLAEASSPDGGPAQATNSAARLVIDILTNRADPDMPSGLDPVALVAQGGLVPLCAMAVTRTTEGGDLSLFAPPDPCGCQYERTVGVVPATCVACATGADCAEPGTTCRHGYCEADDGRTSLGDCSPLPAGATHAQIINNPCAVNARFESDPIP